ncbi:MAG: flavin reductase family protein [Gammaproteobacteria bacterium]|nr:flavin reductase family protein [Gammaproteobacteria bacterium]MBL6998564.1 flavin reductase family protein [Gammaproteobacteria bacterium]
MIIDPAQLDTLSVYKLLVGAVVPRPIAWVSSRSRDGILNLAPFSFFTVASREPPMLALSIGPRTGGESYPKDTLTNLREQQQFVINIVSVSLANAMHETSMNHLPDVDEFVRAGVTPVRCEVVDVPRVAEAKISMECSVEHMLKLGSDYLVIGRMLRYHVQDELLSDGRIDILGLDPLGRMAGNFTRIESLFDLPLNDS